MSQGKESENYSRETFHTRKGPSRKKDDDQEEEERTNKNRKIQQNTYSENYLQIVRYHQQCNTTHYSSHDSLPFELLPMNNKSSRPPRLLNLIEKLMLPWRLKKNIDDIGGHDIRKVMETKLNGFHLSSTMNGFTIPESDISKEAKDFIKPHEVKYLEAGNVIRVLVLDSNLREFNLVLERWLMARLPAFNLTGHWNYVMQCNNIQLNDMVQLWSFRRFDGQLGFALVKL